jgi:hypothetical protein
MIFKILGESAAYYQSFLPSSFLFSQLPEAQDGTETSWLVGLKDQAQEFFSYLCIKMVSYHDQQTSEMTPFM